MRKDYLAFFTSLFLSRLADQMLLFIVPLVVFQATHSASWAGLAFFVESLPRFLAFPVCGALCDKYSPTRILHISQLIRTLLCLLAILFHAIGGLCTGLPVDRRLRHCGVVVCQGCTLGNARHVIDGSLRVRPEGL